ncbi:MAG: hydrolase [Chthoniobacterales bacterium]
MLQLTPHTTALVLIDLQTGILAQPRAPHSAEHVVKTAIELATRFRTAGAPVVLVNVAFSKDGKDVLRQPTDTPSAIPPMGFPEGFSDLTDGLAQPGDIRITKHQWGAFHGTELDLQLRRRGIRTIVLAGIATNMGVESTARQAFEHGYALVIVEDATSSNSAEMHNFAVKNIFPLIARVSTCAEIELKE